MYSSSSSSNEYNNDFHQNPLPHIAFPSNSEMYERCSSPAIVHTQEEVTLTNDDEDCCELSSSSSSYDEKQFNPEIDDGVNLTIAKWAIRNNITHMALDDLLKNLSKHPQFKELPIDSRTLLKTPTKTIIKEIKGGSYYHFGIFDQIEHLIKSGTSLPSILMLMVGIDGLPITKNPPSQLWPILGYFSNISDSSVFIIGSYYGKPKPEDSNEFLSDFVNEICVLINDGVMYNNIHVKLHLKALICDAPAKSFALNFKGHTGKKSCIRCHTIGSFGNNRIYFPQINAPLRTHDEFRLYSDSDFHCGKTILLDIPKFDVISSVPFDYMHCILIGVTKKLLMFWTGGIKQHNQNLPKNLISAIDKKLTNLSQYIPQEFQRNLNENSRKHPLHDVSRWKATELRQCLLYTGMVVFKDFLSKKTYHHFMELCVAIRILSTDNIADAYIMFAKELLTHFVLTFGQIYGKTFMSHNIHITLHIADDVKEFGPLNCYSAFPFESFMQPLKKKIKNGVKPLQQLARRYTEYKLLREHRQLNESKFDYPIKVSCKNKNRPLLQEACDPQYSGWKHKHFTVKLNDANNCFELENGDIIVIENIATSKINKDMMLVIGRRFTKLLDFFTTPCSSKLLGIQSASELGPLQSWDFECLKKKYMCLPLNELTSIVIPLLHCQ